MRKMFGVLVAAGLLVSAALVVGAPAGAAGGTTCKSGSGTATFTPPLPILKSKAKVKDVLKSKGTVSGCSGAVKSATLAGVSPASTGSNCTTLATPSKTPTKVTLTVKWNAGAPSTVAALLSAVKGQPVTTQAVSGSVKSGQFAGSKISGKIHYSLPSGACTTKQLAKVTYADVGSLVIK
jgi:hypothetical protein